MDCTTLLDAALAYASRGWSIIPIRHKPGTSGKQPAVSWGEYQKRQPTDDELRSWFGNGQPLDGLAVIFGQVSGGLVSRDFDKLDAYERWARDYPELAGELPTVVTARGRHLYFRADVRRIIKLADGELRGAGYCLLPPSTHPAGVLYRWVVPLPDGPLPEVDPRQAGLLSETEIQRHRDTEDTEDTEKESNDGVAANGSILSAHPVARPTDLLLELAIEAAIRDTQPETVGHRNRAVFELARALKAIPALADAPVGDLRDIVQRWHERALSVIGTKPFDDTWADFCCGWPNVRFPRGHEPLTLIVQKADAGPPPRIADMYDAPATRRLVAICRELQRASGDNPFFLSCRTVASLVDLEQTAASRRLRMLVADGILEEAKHGTAHRATRYRYIGGD